MNFLRNLASANEHIKIKGVVALDQGTVIQGVWCHDPASLTADVLNKELFLPRRADLRRRFVRNWAARNAQRILSGLGAATLLLPMTMPSHAQQSAVDVTTIDGVVSAVIEASGDVILTLTSGKEVRIPASVVTVTDEGTVLVSSATADAVVEIAMAESGAGGTPDLGVSGILGGLAILGGAAAGGGGGGGGDGGGSDPFESAFVVDGYISGATVFADTNNNGIRDAGELSTITDAKGEFNKALFSLDAPLVSRGGIDISTGETFQGTLKAPAGSGVITPLTTLVQSLVESSASTETPLTAEEAAASVSAIFGLPGGSDILNDDPVAAAEGGASELLQINAVIASTINVVSAGSDEASADANVDAVLIQLLSDLEADADGGLTALTKSGFIAASLTNSGATLQVDATTAGDALTAVAIEINAIDPNAPDALDSIETVQTVVQGELVDAVQASAGGSSGTSELDAFDVATEVATTASLRPVLDAAVADQPIVFNAADADPSIMLFGTGQIGSTVAVTIGDATETSVVDDSGNWTVTFSRETFPSDFDGTASVTASKQVDGQTITSSQALSRPTVLIDTEAPVAPSAIALSGEALVDGIINDGEDGNVTITGQAEPGATVTLTPAVGDALVTQADGTGAFAFDIFFAVEVGTNSVTISQADAAGNSSPGAPFDFGYDPIAPDPSSLDQTLEVNADDALGGITISGNAEAGATVAVEVTITGSNQTVAFGSPVVADGDGDWSVTAAAPADAVYDVTVIQTDAVGNSTSTIFQTALSVDTTSPAAPVLTSGTGYGAGDAVEGVITLVGGTSPLADVELTYGQTILTTTADADGVFSFNATLPEGETQVSITATDAFGNSSAPLDATVTVDITAPNAPTFTDATQTVDDTTIGGFEITGKAEPGSTVTITSTIFELIEVTADSNGDWTTGLINATGTEDGTYQVAATATDAEGNTSATANATRTIDAVPDPDVAITVIDDDVDGITFFLPGDLILQDAPEFAALDGTASADGNVSNVPAGTAVRVIINPGPGAANGAQIELSGVTDANGDYSIAIPDQTFFDIDGMVEAGTLTIEAGPDGSELATFTLDLLVNSAVNDGTGTTFNVGTTAVTPGDDASAIVANAVSAEVTTGAEQTSGLTVVGVTVATDDGQGGNDDFNVLLAYNGTSATPVESFAFDDFSDLPSVSSQLYAFPDELVVAQINATGDLTVETPLVRQDTNALFNIYRIPAADVAAAIPADGSQSNLNLNGVPSFSFSLADIGGTGPLDDNEGYLPFDITGTDGQPVWIVFKEDLATAETTETYLVQIDLATETVNAREIDFTTLVSPLSQDDPTLAFDEFQVFGDEFTPGAIETDADGNFVRAVFTPATPPEDPSLTGAIVYDYGEAKLYSALIGNDDTEDFIVVEGGNTIIDGGAESPENAEPLDNDVIFVGSTTGTETPLTIVDNGDGTVTVSVLTAALVGIAQEVTNDGGNTASVPLPFALQFAGEIFITNFTEGGIYTSAPNVTAINGGFGGAVFDGSLDLSSLNDTGGFTELVTIDVQKTDVDTGIPGSGGEFFGIGFTTDFAATNDPENPQPILTEPIFDTLQLVSNVDGSGEQVIILADSAGRSGQDKIIGFDTSSGPDGDRIEIEATTFGTQFYAGTEVAKVSDGLSILENGIGILVFDTATQPLSEDPVVRQAVTDLSLGLNEDDQLIVLTGDDSGVFVWRIGFDANGDAIESDSIARFDGITASDLGDFNGTNISMTISEFA